MDVLVRQHAPLLAAELSEERVCFARRGGLAALDEAVDQSEEARLLLSEIALIGDNERRIGGGVVAEGLWSEDRRADERHQHLAEERLLHRPIARARFQRRRTVAEHLGGVHLA